MLVMLAHANVGIFVIVLYFEIGRQFFGQMLFTTPSGKIFNECIVGFQVQTLWNFITDSKEYFGCLLDFANPLLPWEKD